MSRVRALLVALAAVALMGSASEPSERLPDPAQEARARVLFKEVRCLVCQNESIDDSEAQLAGDLRRIVREQVKAGRSDAEIRAFLVQRYGEFVLMRPVFSWRNALLWGTPVLVLLAGIGATVVALRRRRRDGGDLAALTPEEEARVQALLAAAPDENGRNPSDVSR